jgi:ADP-heptose:LPS heptosyltransferase
VISAARRMRVAVRGNRPRVTDFSPVPGVRRIVVLRANGLGDYVVAQPALAALRAAYPDAAITLVTSPPVAALLAGRPAPVDEVLAAPRVAGVRGEPGPDGPPDDPPEVVEAFCAALRERRFDLGVQLHGGGGNANPLLLRFGARVTAGSRAPGAAPLDRTVPWTDFQHDLLRWLEVVSLVGAPPVGLRPRVAVTAADRAVADDALDGVGDGPLVAVHPGATDPRRRWPSYRLGELGAELDARGARVVLLGGPGDAALVAEIRAGLGDAAGRAVDLAGRLTLPGMVGVLERADLFVGNDSGPRHLAEAVGTATVGVFTRANLVDVAPLFRARHRVLVSWASRCAACGGDYLVSACGCGATVLGDVEVDAVLAAARELLDLQVREPAVR